MQAKRIKLDLGHTTQSSLQGDKAKCSKIPQSIFLVVAPCGVIYADADCCYIVSAVMHTIKWQLLAHHMAWV